MIAIGFGAVAVAGLAKIGTGFLMANANAEQLMVTMEIATGSIEKATAVYGEMQKLAASTPFELPELVSAAARIESFGISSRDVMDTIGDTAAGTMKSVDQVTNAFLDAGMGQYIRLQELGIDAMVVGDQVELSYIKNGKKITESVDKNNGQMVQSTLEAIWNDKYEGAMLKQSKTFNGQWSTLKDNFNLTMQDMTKGVFEFAKKGLKQANKFFDGFNKLRSQGVNPLRAAFMSLRQILTPGTDVSNFWSRLTESIESFVFAVGRGIGIVKDFVVGLFDAFKAGKSVEALANRLPDSLQGIAAAVFGIADAFGDLWRGYQMGGFSELFSRLGEEVKQIASAGIDLAGVVVNVVSWALGKVPDIWEWFKGVIGVHGARVADPTANTGGGSNITSGDAAVTLSDVLVNIGSWAIGLIPDVWGWLKGIIGVHGARLADPTANTGGGSNITSGEAAVTLNDVLVNIGSWAKGAIADVGLKLAEWAKAGVHGAVELGPWTLNTIIPKVTGWLKDTAGHVWAGLKAAAGWFMTGAVEMGGWTLNTAIPEITGWLKNTAGHVWAGLKAAAGWFLTDGVEMGSWAINTLVPAITGWLKDSAGDVWSALKDAAGWTWEGVSELGKLTLNAGSIIIQGPIIVQDSTGTTPEAHGRSFVQKMIDGIVSFQQKAADAATSIAKSIAYGIGYGVGASAGAIVLAIGGLVLLMVKALSDPSSLVRAWNATWDFVIGQITGLIKGAAGIIGQSLQGMLQGAIDTLNTTQFGSVMVMIGQHTVEGLRDGMNRGLDALASWIVGAGGIVGRIKGSIVGAPTALYDRGVDLVAGIMLGWGTKSLELMTLAEHFPARLFGHMGDVTVSLLQKGIDLIAGLMTGWGQKSLELTALAAAFGAWVFGQIGDVSGTLTQKGIDLIQGLMNGWQAKSAELAGWAANLPGWIAGQVPFLGGALYGAGADAVQGLIDGVASRIPGLESVINTVVGLFNTITGLGSSPWPMMIEAGGDAMDGLIIGWNSRQRELTDAVNRTIGTTTLRAGSPSYGMAGSPIRSRASAGAYGGGGGRGDTYIFHNPIVGRGADQWVRRQVASGAGHLVAGVVVSHQIAGARR